MAELLGVSRSSVQGWERGRPLPLHAIRSLARLYAVPTSRIAAACDVAFPRQLDPMTWRPGDLPVVLRVLREWSGLTQRALAERCGARKDTVRAWESGRTQPAPLLRRRLESLHRLPPDSLLAAYRDRGSGPAGSVDLTCPRRR